MPLKSYASVSIYVCLGFLPSRAVVSLGRQLVYRLSVCNLHGGVVVQEEEEEEAMYGHAGMLGAAAAVWEDLRNSHLLAALLDLPADEDCKPFHQDKGDHKYDPRMSHSEKDRHMEWESGDSSVAYKSSSVGVASRDAASAARNRNKGSPKPVEGRKWQ